MKLWNQWILFGLAGAYFLGPGLAWGQAALPSPELSAIPLEDASAPSLEEMMDYRWEMEAAYQALYSGLPIADELFAELAALPEWDAQQRAKLRLAQVTARAVEGKIEAADTDLQSLEGRQLEGALASSYSLRSGLVSYLLYEEEQAREFLSAIASEDLNPHDLGWFYTLSGLLAERAGRFMEAASFFDQARSAAASPFQRQVAESLIQRNLLLRGQFSESLIRDLERLLEENRNSRLAVQYAQELAISLARSNRAEEALQVLEEQIAFTLPENEDQLDRKSVV